MASITLFTGSYYGFQRTTYNMAGFDFNDAIPASENPTNYDYRVNYKETFTVDTLPEKQITFYNISVPTRGISFFNKNNSDQIFKPIKWEQVQDRWMDSNQEFSMVESDTQPSDWAVAAKWRYYTSANPSGYPLMRIFNNNGSETWSENTIYYTNGKSTVNFFTNANINFTCTHNVVPARYWSDVEREQIKEHLTIACKPYEGAFGNRPNYNLSSSRWRCPGSFGTELLSGSFTNWSHDVSADSWRYNTEHETISNAYFVATYLDESDLVGICIERCAQDGTSLELSMCLMSVIAWTGDVRGGSFGPNSNIQGAQDGTFRNYTETLGYTGLNSKDRNGENFAIAANGTAEANLQGSFHLYKIDLDAYNALQKNFWATAIASGGREIFQNIKEAVKNETSTPYQCVVSCYKLPTEFAPAMTSDTFPICLAGTKYTDARGNIPIHNTSRLSSHGPMTVNVDTYYDGFGDFAPYTTMQLYLPFCGTVDIDPSTCFKGTLTVYYLCDTYTGNVTAQVVAKRGGDFPFEGVVATATGNCAVQVPFSGHREGVIETLGSIGESLISRNPINIAQGLSSLITMPSSNYFNFDHTGSVALTGCDDVVLRIERKEILKANKFPETVGHKTHVGGTISGLGLTGFVKCLSVDVSKIPRATGSQKEEIERLLKEGVYV